MRDKGKGSCCQSTSHYRHNGDDKSSFLPASTLLPWSIISIRFRGMSKNASINVKKSQNNKIEYDKLPNQLAWSTYPIYHTLKDIGRRQRKVIISTCRFSTPLSFFFVNSIYLRTVLTQFQFFYNLCFYNTTKSDSKIAVLKSTRYYF